MAGLKFAPPEPNTPAYLECGTIDWQLVYFRKEKDWQLGINKLVRSTSQLGHRTIQFE